MPGAKDAQKHLEEMIFAEWNRIRAGNEHKKKLGKRMTNANRICSMNNTELCD